MAEEKANPTEEARELRVYEVGYHIVPTVKEEDLDGVIGDVRAVIEKAGGSFIAESTPAMAKLAYDIEVREGEKYVAYDRAYFGWIKFEAVSDAAVALEEALRINKQLLRSIVFETVREDTRAKYKAPQLREVRRTDTIKAAPRPADESAAPVSEADLEKAIQDIITE